MVSNAAGAESGASVIGRLILNGDDTPPIRPDWYLLRPDRPTDQPMGRERFSAHGETPGKRHLVDRNNKRMIMD